MLSINAVINSAVFNQLNIAELKILPQRFVFFISLIFSIHAILLKGVDLVTCNRLQ